MRVAAMVAVVAVAAAACGSGGGSASTGATVTSDDGSAVLSVPDGVGVDGITVTVVDPPGELADAGGVLAYELGPAGTEFPEPAVLEIRAPAGELGVGDGVPVAAAVLVDGDEVEAVVTRTHREGDTVVVRAEVPHFSQAVVQVNTLTFSMEPDAVDVPVGEPWTVSLSVSQGGAQPVPLELDPFEGPDHPWVATSSLFAGGRSFVVASPVTVDPVDVDVSGSRAEFVCTAPTSGRVVSGYGVEVALKPAELRDLAALAEVFRPPGADRLYWRATVTGDVGCLGADEETGGGDETGEAIALDDPTGDFVVVGPGGAGPAEAPPEVDVTGLSCATDGSSCRVAFAGDAGARCGDDDSEGCTVTLILDVDGEFVDVYCLLPGGDGEPVGASGASPELEDRFAAATCAHGALYTEFVFDGLPSGATIRASMLWDPVDGDLASDSTDPITLP